MKVYRGEITYLAITLPPRYTKTEIVIKAFVSWCLAKNSRCKFIHLSYSDDLALDNSSAIKETIQSDEYQNRWPMVLKQDSQSKKKWFNTDGGGMYAVATGGQITGFGAGAVADPDEGFVFEGAILIDDPLKPDDARSETLRNRPNERFNNTIKSRVNSKSTPIILIMQRLHEEDLAGFLLDGGSEHKFFHLNLPALNEDGPSEFDPREKGEALWPAKHDEDDLEAMRLSDADMFAGQMQQRPAPSDGNIFKDQYFKFYTQIPNDLLYKCHSWDMTFKEKSKVKGKKTDFVVGTEWGKRKSNGDFYLLPDMVRARMGFDKTLEAVHFFVKGHSDYKALLIEDKANGSGIISMLNRSYTNEDGEEFPRLRRVIEIEPNGSKIERAESQVPLFRSGNIYFPDPAIAPWVNDFINELKVFPNGKNDDQVDSMTQAIQHLDSSSSHSMGDVNKNNTNTFRKAFDSPRKTRDRKDRIKIDRQ